MGDTTGPVSWRLPALIAFCAALLLALLLSQPDGVIAQDRGGSLEAGRVYAWGANSEGQTGLGLSTDQNVITPQLSQHLENATQIAAGDNFGLAVTSDGKLWAWGSNTSGQLGQGNASDGSNVPVEVTALAGQTIVGIAAGDQHALAVTQSGAVYGWGDNSSGQVGAGGEVVSTPTLVPGIPPMDKVAADGSHSLAITTGDGDVWSWGYNDSGQLGHGALEDDIPPGEVPGMTGTTMVDAGESHSLAIADGQVYAWGSNGRGQLGIGLEEPTFSIEPLEVEELTEATWVSAGENTSLVVNDGTVWGFGANNIGQLGTGGTAEEILEPIPADTSGEFVQVSAGRGNGMALRDDGTVWGWGSNDQGDIGIGGSVTGFTTNPTQALVPAGANYLSSAGEWGMAANLVQETGACFDRPAPGSERVAYGPFPDELVAGPLAPDTDFELLPERGYNPKHTYTVNELSDAQDANLNDGICDVDLAATGENCTLRAAIEQAEHGPVEPEGEEDLINTVIDSVSPTKALPEITKSVVIDGFHGDDNLRLEIDGSAAGDSVGIGITGGPVTVRGLAINSFKSYGLFITGCGKNRIEGNYIGLNIAGTTAQPNAEGGLVVIESGDNLIGGSSPAQRNVISGNTGFGVSIGPEADRNIVTGNFIGTNAAGDAAVPNSGGGLEILAGKANKIGLGLTDDECSETCNLISGNGGPGIQVEDGNPTETSDGLSRDNVVAGNFIGFEVTGRQLLGNTLAGIAVQAGHNSIGGVEGAGPGGCEGDCNLIGGNGGAGIDFSTPAAIANTVDGNWIGIRADGLGNGPNYAGNRNGVHVREGATNISIGVGLGNVISGSGDWGIVVDGQTTTGTVIANNLIGTNPAGDGAIGNYGGGVLVRNSPLNHIGPHNVISGNSELTAGDGGQEVGIRIQDAGAVGNTVAGNFIGTNADGTAELENPNQTQIGIEIWSASDNLVGGVSEDARNVISGNNVGVEINGNIDPATGNVIQGNYIGVDKTGTKRVGNGNEGVIIFAAQENLVGGPSDHGNVISANGGGIRVEGGRNNIVQGNLIGTDYTGTVDLGNAGLFLTNGDGVLLDGTVENLIGGTQPGQRNIISGNNGAGVRLTTGAPGIHIAGRGAATPSYDNNLVQGNYIGTDIDGSSSLPNEGPGVLIEGDITGNTIGGEFPAAGNLIAYNTGAGIEVKSYDPPPIEKPPSDPPVEIPESNRFTWNVIHSNGGLGIDLEPGGVTPNDPGDTDDGANDLQNAPKLDDASRSSVRGSLDGYPEESYLLQVYSNPVCDPSGYGEGQLLLASIDIVTDGSGIAEFEVEYEQTAPNQWISAIVTSQFPSDPIGDTSEFSNCVSTESAVGSDTLFSDSLDRPDADACAMGLMDNELGGSGTHGYIPLAGDDVFLDSNTLEGDGDSGVQFTQDDDACADPGQEGENVGQDLNVKVRLYVPSGSAGPYVRSSAVSNGDNLLDGELEGFRVELAASGELFVRSLASGAVVARTGEPQFFDSGAFHQLEIAAEGGGVRVALDGKLMTFEQNGNLVTLVAVAGGGQNDGAAGLLFSGSGVKAADDIVVTTPKSLINLPVQTNLPAPLFEGWGPTIWGGVNVNGVANVIDTLNAAVDPPLWTTVAWYAGAGLERGSGWLTTFKSAPLPSFNTLTSIRNGEDYWLFATDSAEVEFPQEPPTDPTPTPSPSATPTSEPSATPTTEPSSTPTPSPTETTPTPSATGTAVPTDTPSSTPSSTATAEPTPVAGLVQNGGFESGPGVAWVEDTDTDPVPTVFCNSQSCGFAGMHAGAWWLWFGGVSGQGKLAWIQQDVTIPEGTATLSFWLWIGVGSGTGDDYLKVSIDDDEVFRVTDSDQPDYPAYTLIEVDVSDFADGEAHELEFRAITTGNPSHTNFFVDDVDIAVVP